LVVRLSAEAPTELQLYVAGALVAELRAAGETFEELAVPLPETLRGGRESLVLRSRQPLTLLHYWSFGRVL
jgi:hypothetical protein